MSSITSPENEHDWINAQRGHIALPENGGIIYSRDKSNPNPIWDHSAYAFLYEEQPPEGVVHQSLWRQSRLCYIGGIFQVIGGRGGVIYQVRALDLSNMTIVEIGGTNEVIVIDPLTSVETAQAAFQLYLEKVKDGVPVKVRAMIYTHSHADHFGGAEAILPYKVDTDFRIYAPSGFLEHAVSENVYAGNAMARRSVYMYGESLQISPTGQIGAGLGLALSQGTSSLVAPTHYVFQNGLLDPPIAGMDITCQLTPGTEAPSEMNFFFPTLNAMCMAENATHTLHNLQTLRGAPVRDARLWSRYLDESIALFGTLADVVFSSHHWPTWETVDEEGNRKNTIIEYLSRQRDCYAYLHNETLRHLNNGLTPVEIAEVVKLPPSLRDVWDLKGYYGSVSHNVKAIYDKYMGWFDGNPANLWKHPPKEEAARYVECIGSTEKVIEKALEYVAKRDLRFAATLLNHAVFNDPNNSNAKQALAEVYQSLGQGAENGTWRNIYLTGAKELTGEVRGAVNNMAPESLFAFSLDQLVDLMAIRLDGPKAWSSMPFSINLMITYPEGGKVNKSPEGWHMRLSNAVLTGHAIPYSGPGTSSSIPASLTIYATQAEFIELITGERKTLDNLNTKGDTAVWSVLRDLLTTQDKSFNIVTPPEYNHK
ncbi:beta-lactamase domain-containing protein [Aspergillus nomiae NRRL 13137]|uniref:Beta-lactamase domain-containing protein n=1 Tax=Aspergillus nomiae NRRL (strain ATCC 15546 / NRRL 13137 / CBS 260.88 / M93) TaxID=1509407 RepID=A0A0L1J7K2_ASPN3|nr:beta-lactamase domain-containing protein [Aspergillus nomiae NRRL 13137]KNG87383.1 beta-lactamase domain-containing protein [Aspergillus nomiae NRRL 13137]